MMVNQNQVGGRNYKGLHLQPWDLDRYGVGGLEWTVIKYIQRYRQKDGLVDLQKAEHYIQKIIEERELNARQNRCPCRETATVIVERMFAEWSLPLTERAIAATMCNWVDVAQLRTALGYVRELMTTYGDRSP